MSNSHTGDDAHPAARGTIRRRALLAGGLGLGLGAWSGRRLLADIGPLGDGSLADVTERAVRVDPPDPAGAFDPSALYVALYGHPGSPVLGALGEQGPDAAADRVRRVADGYVGDGRRVVPTFELIGSVASSAAGADGDYSNEFGVERFLPFIDVAARRDYHVVIDLQSGRSSFPAQAREYEPHLSFPHVSLALDPEWRGDAPFRPGGGRIGTVDAVEVNQTIDWLDDLIVRRNLPPKCLIVHQFTPSMITNKQRIRGTDRVQVLLQMDGFGTLAMKRTSWQRLVDDLPPGALTGWKNFYDEDRPTPTPAQTLANSPTPTYVSFQ